MIRKLGIALAACLWASVAFAQAPAQQFQQGLPGSGNAGYPPGSTPLVGVFSGAAVTSQAAFITAPAGQFPYVCYVEVNGLGSSVTATVTPNLTQVSSTGGLTFLWQGQYIFTGSATTVNVPFRLTFTPCVKGGPTGGTMTFNVPGGGAGNTTTNIMIYGYAE
jgi:hypothetical protein